MNIQKLCIILMLIMVARRSHGTITHEKKHSDKNISRLYHSNIIIRQNNCTNSNITSIDTLNNKEIIILHNNFQDQKQHTPYGSFNKTPLENDEEDICTKILTWMLNCVFCSY